jgi:hypothetical protein
MVVPRKPLDPGYCSAKEAEFLNRSTSELGPERRASFLNIAATWAALAKESKPESD